MAFPDSGADPTQAAQPWPLRLGLLLALLEAAVLVLVGVAGVISAVSAGGTALGVNVGVLGVLLLFAAFLVAAVRALHQGRRWGRAPVITWQLLQVAILVSSFTSLPWWLTLPGIVAGIGVTISLLLPTSLAVTARTGHPDAML